MNTKIMVSMEEFFKRVGQFYFIKCELVKILCEETSYNLLETIYHCIKHSDTGYYDAFINQ